jgi:2-oxoisovalerate dehydrogenase E1 component beta subunit
MTEMTLIEAIRAGLDEEMARDERVFITGEDVGKRGGVFRATQGLYEKYGQQRVLDSPLAEASIVGMGIGAALADLRPVCEIQFADFIHPAFNQIVSEAARMYYRSNGAWHVPLTLRVPYGAVSGGAMYHSQSVESFFAHVPGLKVVVASNPHDAKGLLKSAVRDPNPVLYFESKRGYRTIKGDVPEDDYTVPIGPARVAREGRDLSVFAYGLMAHFAEAAAETVAQQDGLDVEVIDLRTLLPVDKDTIVRSVKKTGKALIVYEDNLTLGYGAEVSAIIADAAFEYLDGPVKRLAAPDVPAAPYSLPMYDYFILTPEKIVAAIRDLAAY